MAPYVHEVLRLDETHCRPRDKSVGADASERDRCVVCCRESVAVERIGSVSLVRPTGARVRERGTVKTTEHAGVSVRQAARRIHRTVKQKLLPSGESAQHTAPSVGTAAAGTWFLLSSIVDPPGRASNGLVNFTKSHIFDLSGSAVTPRWITATGLQVHDPQHPIRVLGYDLILSPSGVQENWP